VGAGLIRNGKGLDGDAANPSGIDVRWGVLGLTALLCACADKSDPPRGIAGADADNGLSVIGRTGCAACHVIPGVDWPRGLAGPSLEGFADSPMIGGRFPNQPDVLVDWLVDAPAMAPATAMPAMPLTEGEARDVAAYLYTLDE
jgi:L-cysteine S-thiosulfotransferase